MKRAIETQAIKLNEEHCGGCTLCRIMCPFEAINLDKKTGEIRIDVERFAALWASVNTSFITSELITIESSASR